MVGRKGAELGGGRVVEEIRSAFATDTDTATAAVGSPR
ncbi:hypothetical protein FB558_6979 [Pseudonocardia kunmingensis]|uniref:Uncharacterized protein n=1 Tax=Pseudonocardia kunmingensis TaxID=630975 RepID=A0A543D3N9_9PSEU|nr:hypothetical protein FB558_6979 [Pseudonocardia kunmingensis]